MLLSTVPAAVRSLSDKGNVAPEKLQVSVMLLPATYVLEDTPVREEVPTWAVMYGAHILFTSHTQKSYSPSGALAEGGISTVEVPDANASDCDVNIVQSVAKSRIVSVNGRVMPVEVQEKVAAAPFPMTKFEPLRVKVNVPIRIVLYPPQFEEASAEKRS